jgi:nucleotide-binding universal stress UspA family protein
MLNEVAPATTETAETWAVAKTRAADPSAAVADDARRGPQPAESSVRRILLATDLGASSSAAVGVAIAMAAALHAALIVTTVVDGAMIRRGMPRVDQLREQAERVIGAIAADARDRGIETAFLVWTGEPGPSIVSVAEAEHADLIVVGTHGRALVSRFLVGSVSDHVVRHAAVPVLIVPPRDTEPAAPDRGPANRDGERS